MHLPKFIKKIFTILIFLIITGCGIVTLGYNRLPFLTLLELDSIFDLTDEQNKVVRQELDSWLEWHRSNHLPQYVSKLRQWEKLVIQDLTPNQFCSEIDSARVLINEAAVQFIPVLTPLAKTLSPSQIENWNNYQIKRDKEFLEKFKQGANGEIINEERLKKAISRAEMFYGTLTTDQKEQLAKRLEKSVFNAEQVLPERKRRHADAVNAVTLIQKGEEPTQTLKKVWDNSQQSQNPSYAQYSKQMLQDGCAQLSELHNKTTSEQRLNAAQKLKGYADDFQSLIKP
jgi:hypothetical protein